MAPLRIGVIGAGLIGRRHLTVLLVATADAVAGIADPVPAGAEVARRHDRPYYADFRRMLEEARPDGVIVATPNQLHVPVALAAIERRLPVLVEKPIADSIAAALD